MKKIQKILSTLTIGYFIALVVAHILAVKFASEEWLILMISSSLEIDYLILIGFGLFCLFLCLGSIYLLLFIKTNINFVPRTFFLFSIAGSILFYIHVMTLSYVIRFIAIKYIQYDGAFWLLLYATPISSAVAVIILFLGRLQTETKKETQIDLM